MQQEAIILKHRSITVIYRNFICQNITIGKIAILNIKKVISRGLIRFGGYAILQTDEIRKTSGHENRAARTLVGDGCSTLINGDS